MKGEFEVRITLKKLPLSRTVRHALQHAERYDAVVFTSKNAEDFFKKEIRGRIRSVRRLIRVGPRNDLLKFDLSGKRILFPRSALAPSDIVSKLRAKGATVRVIVLYTSKGEQLSPAQKKRILGGNIRQLYFKSPSGVYGFLGQFRGRDRKTICTLRVRCIGETTAEAAREAGFTKVFIR